MKSPARKRLGHCQAGVGAKKVQSEAGCLVVAARVEVRMVVASAVVEAAVAVAAMDEAVG